MNICMLTHEFPPGPGGVAPYVYGLSKSLTQRGHKVMVITRGRRRKTYHEDVDGISVYRVRFIPSYPSPFWLHGIWVNKLLESLESKFDLLHVHGSLVPVTHTSLPIVFTCHGTVKEDIDNMPVKSFHFFVVKILSKQLFNQERNLLHHADVITAVSQSCAEEIKKYHSINKEIIVVGNGIDSNFFVPTKNKGTEHPYILYCGRLESIKGLTTLVESGKLICKEYPNTRFILVGRGTIEGYLKKMISNFGLENNFYFAGHVSDRNRLPGYYQNSIVYVLPAYYEGLPTALLEAMSCGIPVVATAVGGTPEVITNGENGLLVPPKDATRLAEAILKLLDDKRFRETLGLEARRKIKSNYDWETIVDRIEAVYKTCLSSRG